MTNSQQMTHRSFALTLITGILLIILGTTGIIIPAIMSLATVLFLGWVLILGGIMWGYHTLRYDRRSFHHWFKPVLLIVTGSLALWHPLLGVEAVALLMTIYLILDSYGSFAIAHSMKPAKGTGWMTFNGIVSLGLAIFFLISWPESSIWLVGIFVGISILFDGWALLAIAWSLRKTS